MADATKQITFIKFRGNLRAALAYAEPVNSEEELMEEQFKMDEKRFQEIRDRMVENTEAHFGKEAFDHWGLTPETVKAMLNDTKHNMAAWGLNGRDVVELVNNCAYVAQQMENEGSKGLIEELCQERADLKRKCYHLEENLFDADEELEDGKRAYMALIREQKTHKARIAELELLLTTNPAPLPEETVSDDNPLYNSHDDLASYEELQMQEAAKKAVQPIVDVLAVPRAHVPVETTVAVNKRLTAESSFKYTAYQSVLQTLIRWSGAAFIVYHLA